MRLKLRCPNLRKHSVNTNRLHLVDVEQNGDKPVLMNERCFSNDRETPLSAD